MRDENSSQQNEKGWDCRPAIALETRRRFQRWLAEGWLDPASIGLLERVLEQSRPTSLCQFTYDLALDLGAEVESALVAASAAELLYAAIDFTDDVEDGDANAKLPGESLPVCANTASHLFVLAWRAITELDARLSVAISSLVSGMFAAQRLELTREDWCTAAYERVGRANGGMQIETYVRLATYAAGVPAQPYIKPLRAIGVLMQITSDERSHDDRLYSLPEAERRKLVDNARRERELGFAGLPATVVARMRALDPS